jgi:hypothetical protein
MRLLPLAALALALAATACQGTARGRRSMRDDAVRAETGAATDPLAQGPREPARPDPACIEGTPSFRVIWEALYVERQQVLMPRSGRPGVQGIASTPDLEVVIINASFRGTPEQVKDNRARRPKGGLAKVTDQDMLDLIDSLKKAGFYEYAKPTNGISGLFDSERSRGRITIERGGESLTLLSQRGLGLADETREIPAIYSEAKRAIQVLRNRSRLLEVNVARVTGHAPTKAGDTAEPPTSGMK